MEYVLVAVGGALIVAISIFVERRPPTRRRATLSFLAGVAVYVILTLILTSLPGDEGDAPWRLIAAVLAVAVAVDVLRRVPDVRPTPRRAGVAVLGWGAGVFVLGPIVVAVYVARRLIGLPVISG